MNADPSNPALHFGREVQRARLAVGMTLAEMGRVVGYHKSQVSRVERGVRAPTKKFAQMCDLAFPQRAGWFLRFYEDSRQWSAMPPWFRNWIEHEQRAVNLRIWQPSSLSGLVQTESYALAQLRTFPGATAEQVRERLSARMGRQAILTREMPVAPMVWFLIDEAALRRRTGSPLIMADQLERHGCGLGKLRGAPWRYAGLCPTSRLDRARATRGHPANLATLVAVRTGADGVIRPSATADVPRCHR